MEKSVWATAGGLGIALGLLTMPATAAPMTGPGGVKAGAATSNVEQVRWQHRCWYDRFGDRHCRRVWVGPGYGPGVGLYFDGGSRHHRGHEFRGHGYRGKDFRGQGHEFRGQGYRGQGSGGQEFRGQGYRGQGGQGYRGGHMGGEKGHMGGQGR